MPPEKEFFLGEEEKERAPWDQLEAAVLEHAISIFFSWKNTQRIGRFVSAEGCIFFC